jgi:hypothetical protein
MLIGSHTIIQSTNADADRLFLRDVLGLSGVDSGGGWLIFGLPPSEVAVHPSSKNDVHDLYLICDDVVAFMAQMTERGAACSPIHDQDWGRLTQVTLPGGGKLGVYEARHARPEAAPARRAVARAKPSAKAKPVAKAKRATSTKRPAKPKRAAKKAKRPTKSKAGATKKKPGKKPKKPKKA